MTAPVLTIAPLRIWIPGPPCAQGRGRAVRRGPSVRIVDPVKSRVWKGVAQVHMQATLAGAPPLEGPLSVRIVAWFPCPKGAHRKRPVPMAWRPVAPDADNLAKCLMDAANGLLWHDDRQVVDLRVFKVQAAQGTAPGVSVTVTPAGDVTAALL